MCDAFFGCGCSWDFLKATCLSLAPEKKASGMGITSISSSLPHFLAGESIFSNIFCGSSIFFLAPLIPHVVCDLKERMNAPPGHGDWLCG